MNLPKMDLTVWLIIASGLLLLLVAVGNVWLETSHPCVRYGEDEVLYYQHIGDILVPVHGKACLERKP